MIHDKLKDIYTIEWQKTYFIQHTYRNICAMELRNTFFMKHQIKWQNYIPSATCWYIYIYIHTFRRSWSPKCRPQRTNVIYYVEYILFRWFAIYYSRIVMKIIYMDIYWFLFQMFKHLTYTAQNWYHVLLNTKIFTQGPIYDHRPWQTFTRATMYMTSFIVMHG